MTGIIWTQGAHQVAQKSSTTTWPRRPLSATAPGRAVDARQREVGRELAPFDRAQHLDVARAPDRAVRGERQRERERPRRRRGAPFVRVAPRRPRCRRGRGGRRLGRRRRGAARSVAAGGRARATRTARHTSSATRDRADGVGRRRVERLRAGQRRERALEPGGDEDRRVAGGAEIEIARRRRAACPRRTSRRPPPAARTRRRGAPRRRTARPGA